MACGIRRLPLELLTQVVEECLSNSVYDVLNLRSTCKDFQEVLTPWAFSKLQFRSDKRSANSARAAARKYGQYIQSVEIIVQRPSLDEARSFLVDYHEDMTFVRTLPHHDEFAPNDPRLLCQAARELLAGEHTPLATAFTLTFDYETCQPEKRGYEYWSRQLRQHRSMGQSRVQCVMYSLSRNMHVRKLTFRPLLGLFVACYDTQEWSDLMGRVEEMTLQLPTCEKCAIGLLSESIDVYARNEIVRRFFVVNSAAAQRLAICGETLVDTETSVLMPTHLISLNLRSLKLQNVGIDRTIRNLLTWNNNTWLFLEIRNCVFTEDDQSWADLFAKIEANSPSLREMSFEPLDQLAGVDLEAYLSLARLAARNEELNSNTLIRQV